MHEVKIEEHLQFRSANAVCPIVAYKAVVNRTDGKSAVQVNGCSPVFDREIAERWAQELRDLYNTSGSRTDYYEVRQIGLSLFLYIIRQDSTEYIPHFCLIGADITDPANVTRFLGMLERYGLTKSREDPILVARKLRSVCGRYERKDA